MTNNIKKEPKEILGLNRITKKRILELCKKDKLYQTPELNDVLYLHYQGFQSIECLEQYTELKCLWVECNAISEIQGLDNQTKLKCLFLQSNLIKKIENLECCKELDTINLSQNHIRKIENCGFEVLPALNTLNIASNYLKDCEGLKELENCKNLSVLDLSNNRIDDILVVKIFGKMPELKVLVLQGNPVVSKIPQYRKTLILECKKLTYLDSCPVFPKDRSCAEAWKRGGYEEERKENQRWNRMERRKMRDSVNATIRMRNKNRKPEDQLTLLISSDSEDELDARKRKTQNELVDDVSMDRIWEEVANDSTSETSTSDMTVSSSTSGNATANSSEQDINSEDARANESLKTPDKENICNDSLVENIQVCENMETVSQFLNDSEKVTLKQNYAENKVKEEPQKCKIISTTNLGDEFEPDTQHTKKTKIADNDLNLKNDNIDSDEDSKDQYNHTIDAICQATINNLSQSENYPEKSLKRVQLQIETLNGKDENYEPLKELEEAMNSLIKKVDINKENSQQKNFTTTNHKNISPDNTSTETQYEQECLAVNHQLKIDFEQLSVNMDNFMTQLNKDKAERKQAIEAFFDKKEFSKENSSGSSDNETDDNSKELRFKRMIDQWDTETRLKGYKRKYVAAQDEKRKIPIICINDKPFEEKEEKEKLHSFEGTKRRKDRVKNKVFDSPPKNLLLSQQENIRIQPDLREEIKYQSPENIMFQNSDAEHSFYSRQEIQQYVSHSDSYLKSLNKSKEYDVANVSRDRKPPSDSLTHKENDKNLLNPNGVAAFADEFEQAPMDMKLLANSSNDAWINFEKEAKKLKELLQKLENKNEDLFKKIDTDSKTQDDQETLKKYLHEQKQEEKLTTELIQEISDEKTTANYKKYIEIIPQKVDGGQSNDSFKQIDVVTLQETKIDGKDINENLNSMVSSIIQQLLEELIQFPVLKPFKPKSYDFVIDFEEEYNYSATKAQENSVSSKAIPDVVEPFKQFLKNIALKNRKDIGKESLERPTETLETPPYKDRLQNPTTDDQQSVCLQELSKQANLKDFNFDTHESLDKQLKQFKDEQTKNIRCMVDRVYSQRDRYNDILEVVDGKLLVRNKDTGEVKELQQPAGHLSDSDTDYDTAQSEEEEEKGACCSKSKQNFKDGHWFVPYNPTQQKSLHDLKAHNNKINSRGEEHDINDSDESNDDFFSLDPQAKPNLYNNIDDEFFNTLTLEHLKLTEQDEHHIIQCARSYEELRSFLKLNKEQRCLTEIENELLEKMIERKETKNQENLSHILSNNDGLTKEENLLLKRMVKINKDKEHFYNEGNEEKLATEIDRISLHQCKETFKIFEYNENAPSIEQRETSSETDKTMNSYDDSYTEVYGNDIYTFVYEDPEKYNEICEKKRQYEEIELVENEEELNRQDFIQDLLQRKVSFQSVKAETEKLNTTDIHSTISANSFAGLEKYSEEEKNEIESNIDMEGAEMNKKLEYEPEKKCFEEKEECDQTLISSANENHNVSVDREFSDFDNASNIQHKADSRSLQNNLCSSNMEKQHPKDNTHKSNETPQPTCSTKLTKHKELVSEENVVNFPNVTPDIPPNSEDNFHQSTNDISTCSYSEGLSSFDYIGDLQDSKEDHQSTNTSDIEILECNLEIIGGNDEIIETITVNAEMQYDY